MSQLFRRPLWIGFTSLGLIILAIVLLRQFSMFGTGAGETRHVHSKAVLYDANASTHAGSNVNDLSEPLDQKSSNNHKALPSDMTPPQNETALSNVSEQQTDSLKTRLAKMTHEAQNQRIAALIESRGCRYVTRDQDEFAQTLASAIESGESSSFTENMQARFEKCQSVPPLAPRYVDEVMTLVELKNKHALKPLWQILPKELEAHFQMNTVSRDTFIENRKAFKIKQYALTEALAFDMTNPARDEALHYLFNGYFRKDYETGLPNEVKSFAFGLLFLETTQNDKLYRNVEWLIERAKKRLGDDKVEEAYQLVDTLKEKHQPQ